jgi:hypothetical protein
MKKLSIVIIFILLIMMTQGCGTLRQAFQPLPPITYEEVIRLTHDKVQPDIIIKKIQDSNTIFRLNSEEVLDLRKQGVDSKVVDYMMNTYLEQVRQNQEMEDWNRWWFYGGHYYWWPDWYYYHYPHIYRPHDYRR